jgi:hypothetical protein
MGSTLEVNVVALESHFGHRPCGCAIRTVQWNSLVSISPVLMQGAIVCTVRSAPLGEAFQRAVSAFVSREPTLGLWFTSTLAWGTRSLSAADDGQRILVLVRRQ